MAYTLEQVREVLVATGEMDVDMEIAWLGHEDYIVTNRKNVYQIVDNEISFEGIYSPNHD